MKLEGIRLLVEDFDASFNFYSKILGFKVTWGKPGDVYASFDTGGHVGLSIFTSRLMHDALNIMINDNLSRSHKAVLVFECHDVDKIYLTVKRKSIKIIKPPTDMPAWGNRCMHIEDPEGNTLEFSSALSKDKWDKDLLEDAKASQESTV